MDLWISAPENYSGSHNRSDRKIMPIHANANHPPFADEFSTP
jgi:hypothetical protein